MFFHQNFLDSVVFIGERTGTGFHWGGTGFFVSTATEIDPENTVHALLVTAEHCVAQRTGLVMRVDTPAGAAVLELPDGSKWHRHPGLPQDEDETDIAATVLPTETALWLASVAKRRWVAAAMFFPDEQMSDTADSGLGLGDEVVALGLLRTHAGANQNCTIARTGNIAMLGHESVLLHRTYADVRMRLY